MKEYVLKFVDPQITIQEESKEDFKKLMNWNEETFMSNVFVRLSGEIKINKPEILTADWLNNHRQEFGSINCDLIKEFIQVIENQEKWALSEEFLTKISPVIKMIGNMSLDEMVPYVFDDRNKAIKIQDLFTELDEQIKSMEAKK